MARCDGCIFEKPLGGTRAYDQRVTGGKGEHVLCEICANTMIGNTLKPGNYEQRDLMRTIGWIANRLRVDLQERSQRIEVVKLAPDDIVVLKADQPLDDSSMARIHGLLKQQFPNNKCLILDERCDLEVIRREVKA